MVKAFRSPVAKLVAAPKAPAVRISKIHSPSGPAFLAEHGNKSRFDGGFSPLTPPKRFVFPATDHLVKHLAKTVHFPWEGNKTGTPKVRGAAKAHRQKQISTSGYPS